MQSASNFLLAGLVTASVACVGPPAERNDVGSGLDPAGEIPEEGSEEPRQEYRGLSYFARVVFEGSVTIHTESPCELDGPYDVDTTDSVTFAPTFPVDLDVVWTIGDQVYDTTLRTVAIERELAVHPSGTHNAFFNLGRLDVTVDDPDDPGLAERPFTISCGGETIERGFYLDSIVTEEENEEDGVTSEVVREYIEAEIAYRRSAGDGEQYLEPIGYETFAFCEPCTQR